MNIDHYISKLLEDHDCVIVPEFGGFVANYASARINPINHRFDPPFRKVSFNRLLVHNDGLLASYVARKEEQAFEEALKGIKHFSLYLKDELKQNGQVSIEKVGVLYRQQDGTLRFEQVDNAAFFKEGTGLESFYANQIERHKRPKVVLEPKAQRQAEPQGAPELKVVKRETKVSRPEPVSESVDSQKKAASSTSVSNPEPAKVDTKSTETKSEKQQRRYWPAVAALIGLPVVGYAIWISVSTPLFTDRSQFHMSDLNPFTEKVCTTYEARKSVYMPDHLETSEAIETTDGQAFIELSLESDPDKTLVVKLVDPEKKASSSVLKYHIIGGCFSIESNARGLVSKFRNRGNNASVVDQKGGLHRVSVQSFATKKEAMDALTSIQNDIPGAWLLYK